MASRPAALRESTTTAFSRATAEWVSAMPATSPGGIPRSSRCRCAWGCPQDPAPWTRITPTPGRRAISPAQAAIRSARMAQSPALSVMTLPPSLIRILDILLPSRSLCIEDGHNGLGIAGPDGPRDPALGPGRGEGDHAPSAAGARGLCPESPRRAGGEDEPGEGRVAHPEGIEEGVVRVHEVPECLQVMEPEEGLLGEGPDGIEDGVHDARVPLPFLPYPLHHQGGVVGDPAVSHDDGEVHRGEPPLLGPPNEDDPPEGGDEGVRRGGPSLLDLLLDLEGLPGDLLPRETLPELVVNRAEGRDGHGRRGPEAARGRELGTDIDHGPYPHRPQALVDVRGLHPARLALLPHRHRDPVLDGHGEARPAIDHRMLPEEEDLPGCGPGRHLTSPRWQRSPRPLRGRPSHRRSSGR